MMDLGRLDLVGMIVVRGFRWFRCYDVIVVSRSGVVGFFFLSVLFFVSSGFACSFKERLGGLSTLLVYVLFVERVCVLLNIYTFYIFRGESDFFRVGSS